MDFSMQMVKHLMLEEIAKTKPENSVLSPLSISVVLNMIAAGTTGVTLKNMLKLLKFNSVDEINKKSCDIMKVANNVGEYGPTITSINGIWVDKRYPVKDSYKELLKRIYNCEANNDCDFEEKAYKVRDEINSWAEAASRGLINDLIKIIDPRTMYIRANALYFKGTWEDPFEPEETVTKDFFLLNGTKIQVPFLTSWGGSRYYRSFQDYSVLSLQYEGGLNASFSMYFFLPHEKDKMPDLLEKLKDGFQSDMGMKQTNMSLVRIPKFKFSYDFDASKTMQSMELEIPSNGNQLDFAEMIQISENLPPLESRIFQKAYIEVDEGGTEACAVTYEEILFGCSMDNFPPPPPKPKFVADHPFMFVIKEEKSGLVFFTGVVVNPE